MHLFMSVVLDENLLTNYIERRRRCQEKNILVVFMEFTIFCQTLDQQIEHTRELMCHSHLYTERLI